jgi:hypothetical protein
MSKSGDSRTRGVCAAVGFGHRRQRPVRGRRSARARAGPARSRRPRSHRGRRPHLCATVAYGREPRRTTGISRDAAWCRRRKNPLRLWLGERLRHLFAVTTPDLGSPEPSLPASMPAQPDARTCEPAGGVPVRAIGIRIGTESHPRRVAPGIARTCAIAGMASPRRETPRNDCSSRRWSFSIPMPGRRSRRSMKSVDLIDRTQGSSRWRLRSTR